MIMKRKNKQVFCTRCCVDCSSDVALICDIIIGGATTAMVGVDIDCTDNTRAQDTKN